MWAVADFLIKTDWGAELYATATGVWRNIGFSSDFIFRHCQQFVTKNSALHVVPAQALYDEYTRPLTHFARASAIEVYHLKMMCKQGIEGSAVAWVMGGVNQ